MRILISNDDGVHAIGLNVLANELSKIGEIYVVAPDRERSGASNSLSLTVPIRAKQLSNGFHSVTGTPVDCVRVALASLFSFKFDFVISGINAGSNLGYEVMYSGTVAAAAEGCIFNIPSIAISLAGKYPQVNYDTAAIVARKAIEIFTKSKIPLGTFININVPDINIANINGFSLTRLRNKYLEEPIIKSTDAHGSHIYWVGAISEDEEDSDVGTDFYAIKRNEISITPMKLDMTDYNNFDSINELINKKILF